MRRWLRDEPWPPGQHAARRCLVCNRPWVPFAGSRLPCHAGCFFPECIQDLLLARAERDPAVTTDVIAAELGVTDGIVIASIAAARRRRLKRTAARRAARKTATPRRRESPGEFVWRGRVRRDDRPFPAGRAARADLVGGDVATEGAERRVLGSGR